MSNKIATREHIATILRLRLELKNNEEIAEHFSKELNTTINPNTIKTWVAKLRDAGYDIPKLTQVPRNRKSVDLSNLLTDITSPLTTNPDTLSDAQKEALETHFELEREKWSDLESAQ